MFPACYEPTGPTLNPAAQLHKTGRAAAWAELASSSLRVVQAHAHASQPGSARQRSPDGAPRRGSGQAQPIHAPIQGSVGCDGGQPCSPCPHVAPQGGWEPICRSYSLVLHGHNVMPDQHLFEVVLEMLNMMRLPDGTPGGMGICLQGPPPCPAWATVSCQANTA